MIGIRAPVSANAAEKNLNHEGQKVTPRAVAAMTSFVKLCGLWVKDFSSPIVEGRNHTQKVKE
jgi:hypothetical protein